MPYKVSGNIALGRRGFQAGLSDTGRGDESIVKVLLAILLVSLALGGLFYAFSGYLFPSNNGLLPSTSGLGRPSGPAT